MLGHYQRSNKIMVDSECTKGRIIVLNDFIVQNFQMSYSPELFYGFMVTCECNWKSKWSNAIIVLKKMIECKKGRIIPLNVVCMNVQKVEIFFFHEKGSSSR